MPCCAVPSCKNRLGQGFRFFRFPRDETRREKWVQNMRRENWQPTESSRICNAHFDYSQFELYRQDNLMKLKQNAVPTLFDVLNPPSRESCEVKKDTEPSLICDTASTTEFLLVENSFQNGLTAPLDVYVQWQKEQQDERSHMDKQKSLCRLCLSPSPVQRLINGNESTMLEAIAAIKLSDNNLNKACIKCLLNLKLAFQIQQRIIESHNWFIEHIEDAEGTNGSSCETIKIKAESLEEEVESNCLNNHHDISGTRIEKEHSDKGSANNTNNKPETVMIKMEKDLENKGDAKSIFADFNLGKCPICGKNNSTVEHAQTHYASLHKCDECNSSFKNIQEYSQHMTTKHEMENLNCPECNLCFKYQSLYNIHISTAHPKKAKQRSQPSRVKSSHRGLKRPYERNNSSAIHWVHYQQKTVKTEPGIEELHDCAECGKSFLDEQQYLRHAKVHDKITCPICKREITRYNYSRHYALHGPGMPELVCEICGSVCKNKGSLRTHIYYTHSQRSLPCEHCGKVFRKKYDLVMHTKKEHTGEKNHVCDICGKKYYTRHKLNGHIKILHLKERKFVCRFCDKSLSSKHALRTHERQHTNESPYKCEICGEGFRQNVSLRWHRKSKHNCIEEKTEECKVCGKKFVNIFAVKSHMRMHDP